MRLPLPWLAEFVDAPGATALADLCTAIGLECEGIDEAAGAEVLVLDTPSNRTDVLSVYGLAREIAARLEAPLAPLGLYDLPAADGAFPVTVSDARCPRYLGVPLTLTAGHSPLLGERLAWMDRLPVNPMVDLANVVMFETGQPLHLFSKDAVAAGIDVRDAAEGERIDGLDGASHDFCPGDLVIASGGVPVALAGVVGSVDSGSEEGMTEFLLESATFDAPAVRRTAHRLGLATDSAYRFERRVDPAGYETGARRFVRWCEDLGWGPGVGAPTLAGSPPPAREPIELSEGTLARLGMEVSLQEAGEILSRLGLEETGGGWAPPTWRTDVSIPEDLIEEVARQAGYDTVPETVTHSADEAAAMDQRLEVARVLVDTLVAAGGMQEWRNSLLPAATAGAGLLVGGGEPVSVTNPRSRERSSLRGGLLPGLEEGFGAARRYGERPGWTFEVGTRFAEGAEQLAVAILLPVEGGGDDWAGSTPEGVAGHLKGLLAELAAAWGRRLGWEGSDEGCFLPGTARRFSCAGIDGVMGAREVVVGSRRETVWCGEAAVSIGADGLTWPPPDPEADAPADHPLVERDVTVRAGAADDLSAIGALFSSLPHPVAGAALVGRWRDGEVWALTWRLSLGTGTAPLGEGEIASAVDSVRREVEAAGFTLG